MLWALIRQLSSSARKAWTGRDSNPDLCDTGAVLHQLSYQANWELVIIWVNVCVTHGLGEDIFLLFFRGTGHVLSGVSSVWSKISFSYNTANTSSIAQSYDFLFSVLFLSFRAPTPTLPLGHFFQCRSKGNISGGARKCWRREPLGGSGGMLPQKNLKSRDLEMLFPAFCKSYLWFTPIANYLLCALS